MKNKQVIVVRTDVFSSKDSNGKMSLDPKLMGKIGIQMTHASKAVILNCLKNGEWMLINNIPHTTILASEPECDPVYQWCTGAFTGIALKCKSEGKLKSLYEQAQAAGLPCSYIVDKGLTVFDGVPTATCMAIGPADSDEIDKITGKLRML
jgi:PTH2 family peptidyl-tRNA hydrolase